MPQTITPHRMATIVGLLLCFALPCCSNAQWNPLNPVSDVKREANGVTLTMRVGTLRIQVASESIVRVTYSAASSAPQHRNS